MKLSCVLFLALVAMVTAESYEYLQNSHSQEDPQSNYYSSRRGRPSRGGFVGAVKRLFGLNAGRRQLTAPTGTGTGTGFTGTGGGFTGTGGGFTGAGNGGQFVGQPGGQFVGQPAGFAAPAAAGGGGFPFLPVLLGGLALAGIAGIIGAAVLFSQLNNSGRGLDTDEWEVDHSVWMDQLQRDFEDSWDTES